jgi:hypothetical protein
MKLTLILPFLLLFSMQSFSIVQIDTSNQSTEGHKLTGELSIGDESSKSQKQSFKVNANYKFTHNGNKLIWSQKYDYSEINDVVDTDDYFSHLRYMQQLGANDNKLRHNIYIEYFHQYSTFSSRDIKYRQLLGSGLRVQLNKKDSDDPLLNNYSFGLGAFTEEDKNTSGMQDSNLRLSTYFHYEYNIIESLSIKNTLYWQPSFNDMLANYRLLNTFSIHYKLNDITKLAYYINNDRYKNDGFSENILYQNKYLMLHFTLINI